jgi:hypothetical protein
MVACMGRTATPSIGMHTALHAPTAPAQQLQPSLRTFVFLPLLLQTSSASTR